MLKRYFFLLSLLVCSGLMAQVTRPRNGVWDERTGSYAFTNATLFTDYQTRIDGATLVIRDGKVVAAGANVAVPPGAAVIDLAGRFVYPGLIDVYTDYGMPQLEGNAGGGRRRRSGGPQMESEKEGVYSWNQAVHPEDEAVELFKTNTKQADELRKLGFGAVLTFPHDGIARGSALLVNLAEPSTGNPTETILKARAAAAYSFNKGSSTQDYPSSLMGSIALLRQTYYDAQWYANATDKEPNLSLDAWLRQQALPQVFETDNKLDLLRADNVGDEFGVQYIIKTAGDEYQRLDAIKATGASLIVPLEFPKPYDVEDPFDASLVTNEQMKHWEMAPANAAWLAREGLTFALTTADLKEKKAFTGNLKKAMQYGLSFRDALRALTETPARLLGVEDQLGSLRPGWQANFLIASDSLFKDETVLYENWIGGARYVLTPMQADLRGTYQLQVGNGPSLKLEITGQPDKAKAQVYLDTTKTATTLQAEGELVTMSFVPVRKGKKRVSLSGWREEQNLMGEGTDTSGTPVKWRATYTGPAPADTTRPANRKAPEVPEMGELVYPFMAYGWDTLPTAETVLIRNATVWTNEADGVLETTDVLVRNGKIAAVGQGLSATGATVVDGTGKHLTSGIIDEHSHIAISRGVNEGTHAVTAEVRVGDVVNSEDINIYRQLAGGVTAAQLLHGSANPIGGQSELVKLRWGRLPEELKIEGADEYIKFALGENVKQSNWGDANRVRFPQTRMGVEQVYVDAFQRAKEYDRAWKNYNGLSRRQRANAKAPHRDLQLEALAEILNDARFITCHSYIQSEINMLLHVADTMGFKVNTFTHILEGYKVADKMKAHGAGAGTFSDWWAYKYEVIGAIPYNAAIMDKVGVVTAINSDDAEMARRLNQEAAKTIKYGGLSEEEAWKTVTLNPAKLLHLDDRMGSIKVGKDADLVLWSDHPLSIYAKPEQTYVDGILYFDLARDRQMREEMQQERQRIIQKMLQAKGSGEKGQQPRPSRNGTWDCEVILDIWAIDGE
ncbi:Imidazolonepropionase [Catalinimonas alkaloidigena]|uniref:Imidazolonepropionase n=1 Tax=Catalinimonas alkaloidigena TaxID=1075417 RepID=A0A1G9VS69_9BACT|nr:amidohydrolase family protein [Catalinimonas alkaloidigena]SDM74801.1 Imidazolonepropionase [Catalinimonas alkaloidigena]